MENTPWRFLWSVCDALHGSGLDNALTWCLTEMVKHHIRALMSIINGRCYSHGTRANKFTLWRYLHGGITRANKFTLCHYLHGPSLGRISSHCDVICTGPGQGRITRANKFTPWRYLHGARARGASPGGISSHCDRYLHGSITRANNPQMWTRYALLFPGARGPAPV